MIRVFKERKFNAWAESEGISDKSLRQSITEIENGLVDANLGGGLYKKRIASQSGGKSSGFRTLLAYKAENRAFFLYGFAKNKQDNISMKEKKALKIYATSLMKINDVGLKKILEVGTFKEVV